MARMFEFYDIPHDPFATTVDDISEYYHVQSTSQGGSDNDIIADSALNYPVNTPTRLFIKMPQWIDRGDLAGGRPIQLEDETIASTMTRVTGAPTGNQYRIPPEASIKRDVIEISSTKLGHQISYDYYGLGTAINSSEANQWRKFLSDTLTSTASYAMLAEDGYRYIRCATSSVGDMTITLLDSTTVTDRHCKVYKDNITGKVTVYGTYLNSTAELLVSKGDYIECHYDGSNWVIDGLRTKINAGIISNSDWTQRQAGTVNLDYDSFGGTITEGERVICTTTSSTATQAYGYVMSSTGSTATIILRDVHSTGTTTLFPNNAELYFELSASTALVNEGGGSAKNLNCHFFHGLNMSTMAFNMDFYVFPTAEYTTDAILVLPAGRTDISGGYYGVMIFYVSANECSNYINTDGILTWSNDWTQSTIDTDDWWYGAILTRSI